MAAFTGLAQFRGRAPGHDLFPEIEEGSQERAQGQLLGPPAIQGQHVAAKRRLHRGEAIKLVEHHFGRCIPLELNDNAHAHAVRFVGNAGNALDLLVAHHFCDPLDHRGFVHLIGDLIEHNGVAILANFLDACLGTDHDTAAPFKIRFARARAAKDHAPGGKIRGRDVVHQLCAIEIRVLDQGQGGIDHFAQVMGRNIRRHADGDAARSVDEHVGKARGEHCGLLLLAVVIVLEVDRVFLDIGQKEGRRFVHAHLGVAHSGRIIPVHGAEIALAVQQGQRHGKILRHPHQRIVDRAVTMGVILAHHIAHRAGGFAVGFLMCVAGFMHGKQNAAVHRFQPVTQVWDRARHDHAHRVIEIRCLHLVRDRNRRAKISAIPLVFFRNLGVVRSVRHVTAYSSCIRKMLLPYSTIDARSGAMPETERHWQPPFLCDNILFLLKTNFSRAEW